jgi:hypothetical protein
LLSIISLARSSLRKIKNKNGFGNMPERLENQLCCLFRFDQIPNHESPFTDFSPILADEINRGAGITID